MATATTAKRLLTAEEYGRLPDDGRKTELVRGEVVEVKHAVTRGTGRFAASIRSTRIIGNFVEEHRLGRRLTNDSGVITERDPDTVRGADVAFYSFARVPPGPMPRNRYLDVRAGTSLRSPLARRPLDGGPRQGRRVPSGRRQRRLRGR